MPRDRLTCGNKKSNKRISNKNNKTRFLKYRNKVVVGGSDMNHRGCRGTNAQLQIKRPQ